MAVDFNFFMRFIREAQYIRRLFLNGWYRTVNELNLLGKEMRNVFLFVEGDISFASRYFGIIYWRRDDKKAAVIRVFLSFSVVPLLLCDIW